MKKVNVKDSYGEVLGTYYFFATITALNFLESVHEMGLDASIHHAEGVNVDPIKSMLDWRYMDAIEEVMEWKYA